MRYWSSYSVILSCVMSYWSLLLDILFPHRRIVAELMATPPDEFAARVTPAEGRAGKNIMSLFDYRDPIVRAAIWELKYRGNRRIAQLLGAVLYEEMHSFLLEFAPIRNFSAPLIIPLPLSARRERERGFNQCELLLAAIMAADGGVNLTPSRALRKVKDTPSQTNAQGRAARLRNLAGCFVADASVEGRNIILIDDVATTGATLEEAKRALRRAGAKATIAFTVAH